MKTYCKWIGLVMTLLAMVACTTMQPLAVDTMQLRQSLKVGDEIEVNTSNGQQLSFKLQRIDDNGLHGGGRDIEYGDIRSINRKQISVGRTALLILGVVALGAAAAGGGGGGGGSGGGGY
jgi:hypothetical protein